MAKSYYHDGTDWQALIRGEKGGPGPKGDNGDKGDQGDKGDPGGWLGSTAIPLGTNLNDILTPGSYRVSSGTPLNTKELNYPVLSWVGYIEVYGFTAGQVRQVASGRDFDRFDAYAGRSAFVRTLYDGVWSPWIDMNLDGSITARQIFAPGRPDIAATTPYTQAQLNNVPSGHKYVSLDGPQGAWEWRKRGSTWVCTEGDTGWRNIATSGGLAAGWVVTTGGWGACRIRRIGDDVLVQFHVTTDQAGLSNILTMPDGMRPETLTVQEVTLRYNVGYDQGFLTSTDASAYWGGGGASLRCSPTPVGGVTYAHAERLHTNHPWPTMLPGTPA